MLNIFRNKNAPSQVSRDMANKQKRYEALVQVLHADIYRYSYWLCNDKHIAEDLVQETFLRAWRSLDSLKDDKSAKSWLITIARRENARRFERKQFEYGDVEEQNLRDVHASSNEQEMDNEFLRRQIAKLDVDYREPLVLQVIAGFSGDEIAQILDLKRNTVMTRLFRARSQLKEALEQGEQKVRSF